MQIDSQMKTIYDCFNGYRYDVPKFQRPYAWKTQNLEDYWNDVARGSNDHFLGSIVVWLSGSQAGGKSLLSLIDGQQRMTTSAIALAAARNALEEIADEARESDAALSEDARAEADEIHRLLCMRKSNTFTETLERKEGVYTNEITRSSSVEAPDDKDASSRAIQAALAQFKGAITEDLKEITEPRDRFETVLKISSRIRDMRLIQVQLATEEDAFLVFETLNARGMNLLVSDLVKNLIVKNIDDENGKTVAARRFDAVSKDATALTDKKEDIDRFIWQSWNSRYEPVTEKNLYKEIKKKISNDPQLTRDYLDEIEHDVNFFKYFANPYHFVDTAQSTEKNALKYPEVRDSLRALSEFQVSVANAALLSLFRKYKSTSLITQKQLKESVRLIENFHFMNNVLTTNQTTGGTRGRYNLFAREIEDATSKAQVQHAIQSLRDKLQESAASMERLESGFDQLFYAPKIKLTGQTKRFGRVNLIRYVLFELSKHYRTLSSGQDWTNWSIEHIKPQSEASEGKSSPEFSLGNLTILTKEGNGDLEDGPLCDKRKGGLLTMSTIKDDQIAAWCSKSGPDTVSEEMIYERMKELKRVALGKIWII